MSNQPSDLRPVQGSFSSDDYVRLNTFDEPTNSVAPTPRPNREHLSDHDSFKKQQALQFVSAQWTGYKLMQRVEVGMMIELSTIPLYLYAMYSINTIDPQKRDTGLRARAILKVVLQQEMLHLALAGNLLAALGGSLDLYKPEVVPRYHGHILMDKIPMDLRPFDATSLSYFVEIEGLSEGQHSDSHSTDSVDIASGYKSISTLYENLITGVRILPDKTFANNPDNQFTGDNFFGDQLFAITDRDTALKALRLIMEQGEGSTRVEDSHLDVFSELRKKPDSWNVFHVPTNPLTVGYRTNDYIYKLSLAFDAAYCYLLQTIQRVWHGEGNSVKRVLYRNIHALMSNVLTPLAEILVQQPWERGVAAPCFNYYAMVGDPGMPLYPAGNPLKFPELYKQLRYRMMDAVAAATSMKNGKHEATTSEVGKMDSEANGLPITPGDKKKMYTQQELKLEMIADFVEEIQPSK